MLLAALLVLSGTLPLAFALWKGTRELSESVRACLERVEDHELSDRVRELEDLCDRLPAKWGEFAQLAKRAEERARAVVRSARKELEASGVDHAGLEAEAGELRLLDDDGGGDGEVQPVRGGMARTPRPAEEPPPLTWEQQTIAYKYGGKRR